MKKTLITLCAAVALVGCDQDRGATGIDADRETGFNAGRETTLPNRPMNSGSLTNTNHLGAPGAGRRTTTPGANSTTPQTTPPANNTTPGNQ